MVKGNNMSAEAAPQWLPDAFRGHELIVADSIDAAVAASSQRAPDLILLSSTLLANSGKAVMAGLMGRAVDDRSTDRSRRGRKPDARASAQWIYWFGSTATG